MKLVTLAVFTLFLVTAPAHADINDLITFNDLVGVQGAIPSPYHTLLWSNLYFQDPTVFVNSDPLMVGYQNGIVPGAGVSPKNIAYANGGDAAIFTATPITFTLTSAYFTSTAYWLATSFVDVTGLSSTGAQLDFAHIAINDQAPTLFNFGWTGLGAVSFTTTIPVGDPIHPAGVAGFDFVMDNLQLGTPATPPSGAVPEPGAVFLLGGVGAALLPLFRRRFQRS